MGQHPGKPTLEGFLAKASVFLDHTITTDQNHIPMSDTNTAPTAAPAAKKPRAPRDHFKIMATIEKDFELLDENDRIWVLNSLNKLHQKLSMPPASQPPMQPPEAPQNAQ